MFGTKNGMFIARSISEVKGLKKRIFGYSHRVSFEDEKIVEYQFNWFDEVKIGEVIMPGQFHDITYWKVKSEENLYIIFMNFLDAFHHFNQVHHTLLEVGFEIDPLNLHLSNDNPMVLKVNGIENAKRIKNSRINELVSEINEMSFLVPVGEEQSKVVDIYPNGKVKFGLEKRRENIMEIYHYIKPYIKNRLIRK